MVKRAASLGILGLAALGTVTCAPLPASTAPTAQPAALESADLLITGGLVFDGTGAEGTRVDVLVRDGLIAAIGVGLGDRYEAARRIDASGMVVAPGFIDPHTHAASDLVAEDKERRANLPFAYQGVTTVVVGNDGFGSADVAEQANFSKTHGIGTNVAYLVGHGPVREEVLAKDNRAPNADELTQMKSRVRQAMCEGAWGFSAGLYYVPQNYAATDEVVALASVAGELGGYYDTHMRDESTYSITVTGALDETLEIGRRAGTPVHIAHIKALGPSVWGQSAQMIASIEEARAQGMRVTADQYPWEASGTRVSNALVPRWALEGGLDAFRQRLQDPEQAETIRSSIVAGLVRRGGAHRLLITGQLHGADVPIGQTLADYSEARGLDYVDGAIAILMEGDARVASFNMSKDDIAAFAAQEWVVTGSDGSTGHPRKYASFPKAYRDLVKGELLKGEDAPSSMPSMSLARFIHRSSGQTADIIGLTDRGYLKRGMAADIVVFDPARFTPKATYQSPREYSAGVQYLFVNGASLIDKGTHTNALPGKPLLKDTQC